MEATWHCLKSNWETKSLTKICKCDKCAENIRNLEGGKFFLQHCISEICLPSFQYSSKFLNDGFLLFFCNELTFWTSSCVSLPVSLYTRSIKPQPLLQPSISHQLSSTRPAPGRRCAPGLLVPVYVPGGFLLPAARCVWTLLLARPRHPLRPVLPLHPAEVRGWPWARSAPAVLHHGCVFHDGACGSVLAPGRWSGFTGGKNRPPGHSDQAAQYQVEPCNRHHRAHRGPVNTP